MGLKDSKIAKLLKGEDLMFTNAYSLSEVLGDNLPALSCEFDVYVSTKKEVSGIGENTKMVFPYACFWATSVNIPKTGWTFAQSPTGYGAIEAHIEEGEKITVTFWDTKQFHFSRIIEALYCSQLTNTGMLRSDYKQNEVYIQVNHMMICLYDGAFERPRPSSLSASSTGLLQCEFSFAYEDYRVLYAKAGNGSYSWQEGSLENFEVGSYNNRVLSPAEELTSEAKAKAEEEAAKQSAMSSLGINIDDYMPYNSY